MRNIHIPFSYPLAASKGDLWVFFKGDSRGQNISLQKYQTAPRLFNLAQLPRYPLACPELPRASLMLSLRVSQGMLSH
jgi:hypothetical protein